MTEDWRAINLANWESRVPVHAGPGGYNLETFDDPAYLSKVVRYDLPRLGRLDGLDVVHLQCHLGTDTVSLARLGARSTTGLDFSPSALLRARQLATRAEADVTFVDGDVYDAVELLGLHEFDLVYTGIGAICWLPSIRRWADVVAGLLRPGGRLFMREGHPVLWSMSDPRPDRLLVVEHPYFERAEPNVWDQGGTYVETDVQFEHTVSHDWNHGLGEIITALFEVGLRLTMFVEHDSVPWEAFPGRMERTDQEEWRLKDRPWRLPHSYTLRAVKSIT